MPIASSQPPPQHGVAVIKDNLSRLPGKPGVYRMFGADGEVLYVGKAKNLKNRGGNYAKPGGHTQRIVLMIALTAPMEPAQLNLVRALTQHVESHAC